MKTLKEVIADAKERLYCDQATGEIYRKDGDSKLKSTLKNGYSYINFGGKTLRAHRIAWILTNGDIPEGKVIDHINGNREDNRLVNLRLVTTRENCHNIIASRKKHDLPPNVDIDLTGKRVRYSARIRIDGVRKNLGWFKTEHEAAIAAIQAKIKYHPCADVSRLLAKLAAWVARNKAI